MENKDLDNLFREAFKEAEETPNGKVWQHIEAALDNQKEIMPLQQKSSFHWLYYAAAASVLVALGIVMWTIQTEVDSTSPTNGIAFQQPIDKPMDEELEKVVIIPETDEPKETDVPNRKTQPDLVATIRPKKVVTNVRPEPQTSPLVLPADDIAENTMPTQPVSEIAVMPKTNLPTYKVTEIEDIKPLIEPEEELESMYATAPEKEKKGTIVTSILNTISENIEISNTRDIRFRADEEGSLRIDILNSLVKNRNKKRK